MADMEEEECSVAEEKMIEEKVIEILKSSDMDKTTESQVRKLASEQLGLDLSQTNRKQIVRKVVNSYILDHHSENQQQDQEKENQKEEEQDEKDEQEEEEVEGSGAKEYDDNGDLIICRLSSKRRVSIGEFRGKTLLSIREFYDKDGKELPSYKALTAEQWACLKENVPAIEEAIEKIGSS